MYEYYQNQIINQYTENNKQKLVNYMVNKIACETKYHVRLMRDMISYCLEVVFAFLREGFDIRI